MTTGARVAWLDSPGDENARLEILSWDGRVDNRDDLLWRLRDSLRGDTSSAALVLAAYERWGIPGLGQVIGDWSVVIRDLGSRAIILASDFAGVRPLYYYQLPGRVLWSARVEPLVKASGIETIDETYIAGFLMFGGCPNHTPYRGIYSVPPGQAVQVTRTGTTMNPFWTPPTADLIRFKDERRYEEQLRSLFQEAVSVRLKTEAPVVAELSGGFDSSSVVCMASYLIGRGAVATRQFATLSYVDRNSLDTQFLRETEAFCGIQGDHISIDDDPLTSEADLGNVVPAGWEPLHKSAARVAHRLGAKVLLTGQNGDLLMGNWSDDSLQVAACIRQGHIGQACQEALAWSKVLETPLVTILSRALLAALPSAFAPCAVYSTCGLSMTGSSETSLLTGFCDRNGLFEPHCLFSKSWMDAPPERRKHFRALAMMRELRTLQRPEALQDLDYTHPFAHRPLLEFLMTIPAGVVCQPGEPRRLMRRALTNLWPPKLRRRRSKGMYGAPWYRALRPLALKLLEAPHWQVVERRWVDRAGLRSRLQRFTHGLDCNEPQLRQIILLEYWLRMRGHSQVSEALVQAS